MTLPLIYDVLKADADALSGALERLSKLYLAPQDAKTLRSFTSQEVAELLRCSDGYLRKLHHENKLPDVAQNAAGKRAYTAQDLLEIRHILDQNPKTPHHFLPGRGGNDKLQVWSVVNFKGGSGKSTTSITLAQRLALRGYRVLAVDLDPQGSLTTFFGYQPEIDFREGGTIYDAIRYSTADSDSVPLRDIIRKTYFPNLDLAPGGILLSEFETETPIALSQNVSPVFFRRLQHAIHQVEQDYDLVIIDCPPQLGYLTMSALCASTSILMTIIPERVDCASASQFLQMAASVMEVLHTNGAPAEFENFAYLLTRFDTSIAAQQDLAAWLRELLGPRVIKTPFVKSSAVSDAGLSQRTVFEVELSSLKNRKTYERALESVVSFSNDIEAMIQAAWGREARDEK